jgi:hypothetical protein
MTTAVGNIGGMPKSRLLNTGVRRPIASPQGEPRTKPAMRTGKCMGKSICPILGICPVRKGKTRPKARNNPPKTIFFVDKVFNYVPPKKETIISIASREKANTFMA